MLACDPPKGEGCSGGFAAVRARLEGPRGERVGLADEASAGMGIEEGRSRRFRRNVSNGVGLNSPAEEVVHGPAADCLCFSASLCDTAQHVTTGSCGTDCHVIHVNTWDIWCQQGNKQERLL